MFEAIDKLMLAGLGAMSMSRERAEQIFEEYVEKGKTQKTAKSGFVKEMMDTADKTRENLGKVVSEHVRETIGKLDLATREDIERLESKLDQLLQKEQ